MLLHKALDGLKEPLAESGLVGATGRRRNEIHKRFPSHRSLGRVGQDPLTALTLGKGLVSRPRITLLGPEGHHEFLLLERLHEVGTKPSVVAPLLALAGFLLNQHRGDTWQQDRAGL